MWQMVFPNMARWLPEEERGIHEIASSRQALDTFGEWFNLSICDWISGSLARTLSLTPCHHYPREQPMVRWFDARR
jgi:hypothetical protein